MRVVLATLVLFCAAAAGASAARQSDQGEAPAGVVAELFKGLCKPGCTGGESARWRENLRHESHDLNGDGVPELFLRIDHPDWCGAGGNCDYWVFRKSGHGYRLLLNDKVLAVRDTSANGNRDLASEVPMGACAGGRSLRVTLYRHDGKKYRPHATESECRAAGR